MPEHEYMLHLDVKSEMTPPELIYCLMFIKMGRILQVVHSIHIGID